MVTTLLSNNTLLIIRLGSNRICTSLRVKVPFCPYFARSKFPEFQNLFASHICSPAKENLYGAIWKMSSDKAHNSSHYSTKRYKYHRGTVNVTEKYPESEEQSEERRGNEVRKDKTSSRKCKAQVEDVSLTSNCSSTTTHAFEDVKRASVPRSLEQKPRKRKQKLRRSSNSPIEENHLERPCSSGSHRSTKKWRKLEKSAPGEHSQSSEQVKLAEVVNDGSDLSIGHRDQEIGDPADGLIPAVRELFHTFKNNDSSEASVTHLDEDVGDATGGLIPAVKELLHTFKDKTSLDSFNDLSQLKVLSTEKTIEECDVFNKISLCNASVSQVGSFNDNILCSVSVPSVADVTKHEILDAANNNIFNNVVSAEGKKGVVECEMPLFEVVTNTSVTTCLDQELHTGKENNVSLQLNPKNVQGAYHVKEIESFMSNTSHQDFPKSGKNNGPNFQTKANNSVKVVATNAPITNTEPTPESSKSLNKTVEKNKSGVGSSGQHEKSNEFKRDLWVKGENVCNAGDSTSGGKNNFESRASYCMRVHTWPSHTSNFNQTTGNQGQRLEVHDSRFDVNRFSFTQSAAFPISRPNMFTQQTPIFMSQSHNSYMPWIQYPRMPYCDMGSAGYYHGFSCQSWSQQGPCHGGARKWSDDTRTPWAGQAGTHLSLVDKCEEVVNSSRHWLQLKPLPPPGTPGMEFSLMSYNILAQSLLEMHDYLYSHCKHRDLLWPRRGSSILRQIITHNADIVCLQEVQADHWKYDIRPVLNSYGYYGVFKKRVGDKPDGCAILYKLDKFRHIKFVPVQFQQGGILDRDNIGIILLLQPKDNFSGRKAKTLCVATTHLLFNPRRGDVKLAQLIMFLAEIDKVAAIGPEDEMGRGLLKKKKRRDRVRRDKEKTKLECNYQSGKGAGESESISHQSCHPQVDEESLKEGEIKEEKESFRVTIYKCKEKDREVREGTSRSEFSQHNESRESEFSTNQYDTQAHAENIEKDENEEEKESSLSTNYCPIILCGDFNSEPFCDLYKFVTSGHLRYEGLISRLICGQSEGRERGFNDYLGPYLLPSNLSISESCQYTRVIMERQKRLLQNRRSDRSSGNREKDSHSRSHFNKREEMGPKGSHMNDKDEGGSRKHRHEHPTSSSKIATREGERVVENDLDKSSLHTRGVRDGNDVEKMNDRSSHDMDKEKESEEPIQLPGCNTGQAYHRMNFRSVYSHLTDEQGPDGEYVKEVSSQHDKCSCTVDYIFYSSFPTQNHNRCGALNNKNDGDSEISSKMVSNEANKDCALETATFNDMDIVENRDKTPEPEQEQQLELLARYSLLTADQTADSGHLPNAIFPSDHLCLISKFFLR